MVTTREQWVCESCGTGYDRMGDAIQCEQYAMAKPIVQVGDIVIGSAGYGWFSGDPRWIQNPEILVDGEKTVRRRICPNGDGNCFSPCCTLVFYYVVTMIDNDDERSRYGVGYQHEWRYHLFTKAIHWDKTTSDRQSHGGYTYAQTHITPKLIENPPPFVVSDSKDMIGKKAVHLL